MEDEYCVFNFPLDQPEAVNAYFHKVKNSRLFCIGWNWSCVVLEAATADVL